MDNQKRPRKIYITPSIEAKLKSKAEAFGFSGRGWLSNYLTKISDCDFILLDDNSKEILKLLLN